MAAKPLEVGIVSENSFETYSSSTNDRGVTTVPSALRRRGAIRANTLLKWVAIEPELWLVGPATRRPELVAPEVSAALVGESPFQKIVSRVMSGEPFRGGSASRRKFAPVELPELSEQQMVALGGAAPPRPRHRGRE